MKFWKYLLKKLGWEIVTPEYLESKGVVAIAPHTSFYDGFIGMIAMKSLGINYKVVSAKWLFFWPFKYVMKYMLHSFPAGKGIGNAISTSVNILNSSDNVNLIICPEGTRQKTDKWNKGFYTIAKRANVPINLVALDYKRKKMFVVEPIYIDNMTFEQLMHKSNKIYKYYGNAKYSELFSLHNLNF